MGVTPDAAVAESGAVFGSTNARHRIVRSERIAGRIARLARWSMRGRCAVVGAGGVGVPVRDPAFENEFYLLLSGRRSVAFGSRIALGGGFDVPGGNKGE